MLLFVALERSAWAIFKIITSALVVLLLLLFILYARKRRRHLAGHSKERCVSVRGGSSANVRLVEVKVDHPAGAEDSRRDAKASKLQVETDNPESPHSDPLSSFTGSSPSDIKFPALNRDKPQEHLLTASDRLTMEDPAPIKAGQEGKCQPIHEELKSEQLVRPPQPRVPGPHEAVDGARQPASGNGDLSPQGSRSGSKYLSGAGSPDFSKQVSDTVVFGRSVSPGSSDKDPFSRSISDGVSLGLQGSWKEWKEDLRPRKLSLQKPMVFQGGPPFPKKKSSGSKAGLNVRFESRVSCRAVPHLSKLSPERKAAYWWQPDDFAEFLKVRIEIGKAYRLAARKLGVDIMKLSSVGTHATVGYKTMIQQMPELANESRRGLGLGRKRQRAKNRDQYIETVLKEQSRQRAIAIEAGKLDPADERAFFELDASAVALAAERVSEKDRKYSVSLARSYLNQAKEEEKEEMKKEEALAKVHTAQAAPDDRYLRLFIIDPASEAEEDQDEGDDTPKRSFSEELRDEMVAPISPEMPKGASQMSSKGFGLTRDHLAQKGLSATGHYISKNQRQGSTPIDFTHAGVWSDESDGDFTTDADDTDADGSLSGADCSDADSPRSAVTRRRSGRNHGR
mmetsp:Transcript_66146/g.125158  ORF Transcript_66146/g.125158 Transcript_66146/m.125158 type:complete len:624 (-) Transcript_66146:185-2056(-)